MLLIYGICLVPGRAGACSCRASTQLYAFLGVFVAFGLVLFLPTRGDFDRPDELEAEADGAPDATEVPGEEAVCRIGLSS